MADASLGLEAIKVIASVATPIIVLLLGIWAKNIAVDYERRASLNGRIIERRVEIYEEVKTDINDIFVFLTQVGNWKEFTAQQIVEKKRRVDKTMYTSRPYWSDAAFHAYMDFMNAAFETYTGVAEDAKIRTETWQFEKLPQWDNAFSRWFSTQPTSLSELRLRYDALMKMLAADFGYYQEQ
ncbi:hypothetical protein [Methylomonas sp. HYX-M1]|uniref:hypothetical protein n=1 Tax=Methylomonas sp. HYX-M1 TaxID=3139307 RepID=UPI00345B725C